MPRIVAALLVALLTAALAAGVAGCGGTAGDAVAAAASGDGRGTAATHALEQVANGPAAPGARSARLTVHLAGTVDPIRLRFRHPPRAGLLFDLDSGRVLWRLHPTRILPIASLTKIMTALVVVDRVPPGSTVRVTKQALRYTGSGVGMLPLGKWIGVSTMLHGLLLPSGNDAAIALAQRAAGTQRRFIALMNERAAAMGLRCTHYTTPSGIVDRGNHSCPADLAVEARALLDQPRLARIVRRRQAVLPFPIKGGRLYLSSHNPLILMGYRGTIGIKTGYTDAAGRCLVGAVKRGGRRLGVVLLHSPDPGGQARRLLDLGFRLPR